MKTNLVKFVSFCIAINLSTLAITASSAVASQGPPPTQSKLQQVSDVFTKYFYSKNIDPRYCNDNIANFMKQLTQNDLEVTSDMIVAKITQQYHQWGLYNVVTVNSRWGTPINGIDHQSFKFHFFAIYQGYVFDFHFMKEPKVIPLIDYLHMMYVPRHGYEIHGPTFRTRGQGPVYEPHHALAELKDAHFSIYTTNADGQFTKTHETMSFDVIQSRYGRNCNKYLMP